MSIYNVNKNYQAGIFPEINTRGAYGIAPAEGSSNIQMTGLKYAAPIQAATQGALPGLGEGGLFNDPEFQKMPLELKKLYLDKYGPSSDSSFINRLTSPEYAAQLEAAEDRRLQKGLAAYKEMGDQQMKYKFLNEGLAGLREGIKGALTRYPDPATMAQLTAGVGDAYIRGAEATRGLTQLGGGGTPIKYYNV
jgi:hypothetical protein